MNKLRHMIAGIAMIGMIQVGFSQSINVTRNLPLSAAPGSEFTVELIVDKGSTTGFAKLQDELPDGFTASAIESKSATFTFDKNKVKLIWMSLPADTKYTVSYKVKVDATASGTKTITGTFSYIDGNDTKKITVASSSINLVTSTPSPTTSSSATTTTPTISSSTTAKDNPPAIKDVSPAAKEIVAPIKETPAPIKETPTPVVIKTPEPTPAPPAMEPIKTTPLPVAKPAVTPAVKTKDVSGIIFRVQIGAGQNSGSEGYLKSKYNITDEVFSEQIDGLYKYTVGSFSTLNEAKDYRDKVRSNGAEGAFIVSYQNGSRIPLQDALKISGQ